MSMLRPMRNDLFKYRKRKKSSIYGSTPGVPYNSYRKSRRYVSGLPYVPRGPSHHDLYNWGIPSEYHPKLNSPSVDWTEYNSYDSSQVSFAHTPPIRTGPFHNGNASEMAGMLNISSDDLALEELWSMAMGISPRPQEGPMSADEFVFVNGEVRTNLDLRDDLNFGPLPDLSEITDTLCQLEKVLPQDHPDIVNLINAADMLTDGQFSADREASQTSALSGVENSHAIDPHEEAEQFFKQQMKILDKSFEPSTGDPYEADMFEEAEQIYEQKMQSLESTFEEPIFEPVESQVPEMFEEGPGMFEQQLDEAFMEVDSLEQIVEQEALYETPPPEFMESETMPVEMESDMNMPSLMPGLTVFDIDPAIDEIHQAIDELVQQPIPQEMEHDPSQPQYDPYMMGQNINDQMQYMIDPFMMHGPMPGP